MSSWMSRLVAPSQAVRTMKPPSAGRSASTMARSRSRSAGSSMRREMPMCRVPGISTRWRPGREMSGRHARTLGPDRLLGHLDEELVALRQPLLDGRERRAAPRRPRGLSSASLAPARPPTARRRPVRSARCRPRHRLGGSSSSGGTGSAPAGAGGRRRGGTPPCPGRCRRTRPACPAGRAPPCPCRCCRRCRGRDRAPRRARSAWRRRGLRPGSPRAPR